MRIDGHIGDCDRCRRLLARLERTSEAIDSMWQELSRLDDDSIGTLTAVTPAPHAARATMVHLKQWVAARNPIRSFLAIAAGLAVFIAVVLIIVLRERPRPLHPQAVQIEPTPNRSSTPETGAGAGPGTSNGTDLPGAGVIAATIVDNGRTVTIDDHRNLSGFEGLPNDWQQAILSALELRRFNTSARALALKGQPGNLRGRPEAAARFELISPVGDVVESLRPVLTWRSLSGAVSYDVSLFDSAYQAVASSGPLTGTEWRVPFDLRRGSVYSWQVTGRAGHTETVSPIFPAPEARFMILDANSANDLRRAKGVSPRSQLLMALLYAKAGLLHKAEGELGRLHSANPDSKLLEDLLRSLRPASARQPLAPRSGAAHQ